MATTKRQRDLLRGAPSRGHIGRRSYNDPVSRAAAAEAARAVASGHRTITAELMGDPLPGRSALDRSRPALTPKP